MLCNTCSSRTDSLCALASSSSSVSDELSDKEDSESLLSELGGLPPACSFLPLLGTGCWPGANGLGSSGILAKRDSKTS